MGKILIIILLIALTPKIEAKKLEGKIVIGKNTIDAIFDIPFKLLTGAKV